MNIVGGWRSGSSKAEFVECADEHTFSFVNVVFPPSVGCRWAPWISERNNQDLESSRLRLEFVSERWIRHLAF